MEHQKILYLLTEASNSKFIIRKGNVVNDQSNVIIAQETKLSMADKY